MTVKITHHLPKIVNITPEDLDGLIRKLEENNLNEKDRELIKGCIEFATWLPGVIREKDISIRNLQRMLFGETNKKKKNRKENQSCSQSKSPNTMPTTSESTDENAVEETVSIESAQPESAMEESIPTTENTHKGHGRLKHSAYQTAVNVFVSLEAYVAGDLCPMECGGRLYEVKPPKIIIRITGNPIANVDRYHLEKLRCGLCAWSAIASLAPEASPEKYDAAFKAQLVMQKYYMGTPFYRQSQLQSVLGFPLPASNQFELVEQVADCGYKVISVLEKKAANGERVNNDDTKIKILSVLKDNQENPEKKRVGTYATGIIAKSEDHLIALYYIGTQHSGENLNDILRHRDVSLPPIIQMADGSSMNIPKTFETILCNCLSHGFRKFRDLLEFFPEPCLYVIKALSAVFKFDEDTQGMNKLDRFRYHRQHSKLIMLSLNRWLKAQLSEKHIEPNSSLGKAICYLLNHWKELRRFLTVPGAPIDNNIVERALKIPIRVRKNALFYKTEHGAIIGSILTSLIQTTILAKENPMDYLIALQNYKSLVFKNPEAWLPWNFRDILAEIALKKVV